MNRRDRKAAVAKAKAEGMNRRDRKALGRKLRADNLKTRATEELAYLRQRKRDLVAGQNNFEASESAAGLKAAPYRGKEYALDELLQRRRGRGLGRAASSILSSLSSRQ